ALVWRMISSIGRSNWKFTGLTLNLALASASGLMSCCFMRLLVLVCFSFHRRACLLGSQTTNRFFNYSRDIPRRESEAELGISRQFQDWFRVHWRPFGLT